jgi:hypothetical protein
MFEVTQICDTLNTRYDKLTAHTALLQTAKTLSAMLGATHSELASRFAKNEEVVIPDNVLTAILGLDSLALKCRTSAVTDLGSLEFTDYENKLLRLLEKFNDLRRAFFYYDSNSKIAQSFERQILSLGTIFDEFVQAQNTALQTVLDRIGADVGAFYKALHPSEDVDKVRLAIVGEEGIEFEYYFHGKFTYPPMKYLSESHLNSLGVVLFLASAKLFNRTSQFLVLDDIVTSFDLSHRRRLLRLIKEEFSDWQIVLLTHEAFWFDMIKKELVPEGWLVHEVEWDGENGIRIETSARDLRAFIASKRQRFDVSNDLRKLLEATLKEICVGCEVKMAFRHNDQNERRMSGELLSELRSTINRKCQQLKGSDIFDNLGGSNLIATVGSHDNSEAIVGGDIDVALSDIDKLRRCLGHFARPSLSTKPDFG